MKPTYNDSDHYDASKGTFKNPENKSAKSLWQVIKWKWSSTPAEWPKWVENTETPVLKTPTSENQVNISFVNHSTFLIEHKDLTILTDPVWSYRVSPVSWAGPARHHAPGIKLDQLPKIDIIVISHNHYDHMDLATLKTLDQTHQPLILCPLGDKALLDSQGLSNVKELDWWQEVELNKSVITFVPAQHFSGRGLFDRFESLWGGYVIQTPQQKKIFFGGDTGYSSHFKQIRTKFGPMDLSFIPIGAYEPRWFMQAMHINPAEAVSAHIDLASKQSIGIHFGTFQLTDEAIDAPLKALKASLDSNSIAPEKFITLKPGQSKLFEFGL